MTQVIRRGYLPAAMVIVLAMAGCERRPEVKAARYLALGMKFAQANDHTRAVLQFRNAVREAPKAPEAVYQMGLSYLALGDGAHAVAALNEVIRLDKNHPGAQLKLVELMISTGQKEVLEQAEALCNGLVARFPENADVWLARAGARLGLGELAPAEKDARQALEKRPKYPRAMLTLALIKLSGNDLNASEQWLKESSASDPKSAEAATALGKLYVVTGRTAEAETWLRRALQIDSRHAPALMILGELQMRAGNRQQADETYKRLAALPGPLKLAHAWFLTNTGQESSALAELERLYKQDPKDRAVRTRLVKAYMDSKRGQDASRILTEALSANHRDPDALMQRGQLYLESGKLTEAQADLLNALGARPESADTHYLLSRVYQRRGQPSSQQQELTEALRLNAQLLLARVDLGYLLLAAKNARAALDLVNTAPPDQRDAVPVVILRNWAFLALGETAEARKSVVNALTQVRLPELLVQDGLLKLHGKDLNGARRSFEEALQKAPEEIRALDGIVVSYGNEKQPGKALARIREAAALRPGSASIQRYLGQYLFQLGDLEGSRAAFLAAKAADPGQTPVDLDLARVDIKARNFDGARQKLAGAVAANPQNVEALVMLGMLEQSTGGNTKAIEYYRKAVELDEGHIVALNNFGFQLSENAATLDEGLKYAQRAKQLAQDSNPAVDDTLGWIFYRKGIYRTAVQHLESAVNRQPTARRKYHLAMAYFKSGAGRQARQTLVDALKMDPSLSEAQEARHLMGVQNAQ